MRHDPGMRLRAINRNPEAAARVRVRGAFATANEGSAGGEDSGFHAVRATRAEFHDRASGGSVGDAGCFAGDKRLKMKNAEEAGFDKLRLCDGGGHAQKRFTGEKDGSHRRGAACRNQPPQHSSFSNAYRQQSSPRHQRCLRTPCRGIRLASRAARTPASTPCARREPNSTTGRPEAALVTRAAPRTRTRAAAYVFE